VTAGTQPPGTGSRELGALALGMLTGGVVAASWSASRGSGASPQRWTRRNYRDREVSLLLGPAVGAGVIAGVAAAQPAGAGWAILAVSSSALVGGYDDLYGDRHAKGLRGHLKALREGRLTTGMVKLGVMSATAALASRCRQQDLVDAGIGTILVAGGANLVNLLDLRPGRAAKATLLMAAGLGCSSGGETRRLASVAAGASVAVLPLDLGERAMLGDAGASALGALLGWSASVSGSRGRRFALAVGVVALTVASERVSFSAVIDRNRGLRALDLLGRRPT
jgi:UDP-GlcNAc:undecaprenyl-phosphate/decaprenyl-phosphate GlcNAc-1-phosphate transferase